jgi:2-methylcitrate dehydratase PrpD
LTQNGTTCRKRFSIKAKGLFWTSAFVEDQLAGNNSKAACTVVSTAKKVSAVGAALANGIAANGLDMDDGYKAAKGHPGAALLPVLLAA